MLTRVHFGGRDLLRERHGFVIHPNHRDTPKFQTLHGVHARQPYPLDVRCGLILDAHRRDAVGLELVVHLVQGQVEPGTDGDLGRVHALPDPVAHAFRHRGGLVLC